jgi:dihydroneopterin aldolase
VIVPGGGPFADSVRREQKRIGFDDQAAHRMALLAMAAFGTMLASFSPALRPAATLAAIKRALAEGAVPVWLPLDLLDGDADVPASWEMTSDSLAAWLAGRLKASRLIFLKRATPAAMKAADLVAAGVLDPLAPRFLEATKAEAWLCRPRDIARLGPALAEGTEIGRRIEVA